MAGALLLDATREGFGDCLQGIRFAAMARRRVGSIALWCSPSLVSLMARCPGVDHVVARLEDAPPFEAQAGVLDLAMILRVTPAIMMGDRPYLTPDPAAIERWRPVIGAVPGFRVGVSWQGNALHPDDRRRSIRPTDLAPLAAVPGVRLISLQKNAAIEQLADAPFPVHDLGEPYHAGDWDDTTAVVSMLDLVVNPDSSIAHLVGGLGRPAWIALPKPAEWRSGREGGTTR